MRRSRWFIGLAAITAGTLTACSSSSSSSTGSDADSSASFEAAMAAHTKQPTSVGDAPALAAPPPSGKKFVQISNGAGYDQVMTKGFKAATTAIGWEFSVLQAKLTDPATTLSAVTTAINSGADAVGIVATPIAVWRSAIPAARARGTLLVITAGAEDLTKEPAPEGVVYVQNGVANAPTIGTTLVDAALADAGTDPKDIEMVSTEVPQLGAIEPTRTSAERARLVEKCPSCKLDAVQIPFADITGGKGAQRVVAYLQSHPKTKYVLVGNGQSASGLSQAIRAASLPPVTILGSGPGPDQLKDLTTGANLAWLVLPQQLTAWQAVDVAIRHFQGQPTAGWKPAFWLVTKANVDQIADFTDPNFPPDQADQFRKLWKLPAA